MNHYKIPVFVQDVHQLRRTHIAKFRRVIYSYYHTYSRKLPWRETNDPYRILISEIMLQQTQVSRVLEKYVQFITQFPTIQSLAGAPLKEIYTVWQGLGYNRRILYLQKTAQIVQKNYNGSIPSDVALLYKLPGIGKNTASAIVVFAYNLPVVFIETNIRTVYIHFFAGNREQILDTFLLPFIERTLDRRNPREWYYALMDYGVMLKKEFPDIGRKSLHYSKQSSFEGSQRQIRGNILKCLQSHQKLTGKALGELLHLDVQKLNLVVEQLCNEKIIQKSGRSYFIP